MNQEGKYCENKKFYNIKDYNFNDEVNILKEKYKNYLDKIYENEKNTELNINIVKFGFKRFFKSIKLVRFTVKYNMGN